MKPANFAAAYCAMYPQLAEVCRSHGYALAIHGSLARDFDLVAIPWIEKPSEPKAVIDDITTKYALRALSEEPTSKPHGRICWILSLAWGECACDFSFMPIKTERR